MADTCLVHYQIGSNGKKIFFDSGIQQIISLLAENLSEAASQIIVFPDAAHKTWGLPTGTAVIFEKSKALLLPLLLRDPGCGYLNFKIRFQGEEPENFQREAAAILNKGLIETHQHFFHKGLDLEDILYQGAYSIAKDIEKEAFLNTRFSVDSHIAAPNEEERKTLTNDLYVLTNTIEIKKIAKNTTSKKLTTLDIQEQDLVGFVHSGCNYFPQILAQKFVMDIAAYSAKNQLATLEEIKLGIYGVPLESELGHHYYEWLKAAMNYASFSRYGIYLKIKERLEEKFPCEFSLINDNMHAGVFEDHIENNKVIKISRGAQNTFYSEDQTERKSLNLIAGQRETISVLTTPKVNSQENANLIAHGTSYNEHKDFPFENYFDSEEIKYYLSLAQACVYNTQPEFNSCIPFTYNLLAALDYFEKEKFLQTEAILTPYINLHGKVLQRPA